MNLDGRKYVILVFFILVGSIYLIRLFFMQVVDDSWKLRAQEIAEKRKEITPPRGIVFDRRNKKVVTNRSYYNLMMKEEDIHDFDTAAFARLVEMTPQEVKDRFYQIKKEKDSTATGAPENYRITISPSVNILLSRN